MGPADLQEVAVFPSTHKAAVVPSEELDMCARTTGSCTISRERPSAKNVQ